MEQKKEKEKLISLMVEKSQESFLLGIEIYNKPTIKYKVEGFTFFICNAWELLLKAHMLKSELPIYYKNKNKNRTISLTDAIKKIMTNSKDPIRINLEAVVGLRNMANHLIVPEYAIMFNDIFMACVMNYTNKLYQLFQISINDKLPSNYITMFLPSPHDTINLVSKYNKEIYTKFESTKRYLEYIMSETSNNNLIPQTMAFTYQITVKQVNNAHEADFTISKSAPKDAKLKVIHKPIDSGISHPLSTKQVLDCVNSELLKLDIKIAPISDGSKTNFTTYTFNLYNLFYNIKEIPEYSYKHILGNRWSYTYSYELVQKIIDDICNDQEIFKKIKDFMKIKKN
ncbi:DUF3644 domain-containing protein [Acholeplasma hippikon]|uniref:Protein of uncharacterized function (DUF3644) n=1 Tax=Acholeplasma hippikon TaxID=264636 RepID=A0A449BJ56_9MOLU|nr:DUF3644 domain-containing protein [Acholeplasma hippikon]VEU82472.1 Protein of uncharacterised function (DUF3644) [Acholeplasma hippikon]